jgi:hypothetical protein
LWFAHRAVFETSAVVGVGQMPSLIVVRLDEVVVMMFVCLQRVLVRLKTPASLRLLFLEVPQHDKTVLLLYQKYVFLLKRARRFQGSPTPGTLFFVRCSCCVYCNPMAAMSLRRRELGSPEKINQLSVPMRRGRVYHGGSRRVSFEMVQLADKQSKRAPAYFRRERRNYEKGRLMSND